MDIGRMVPAIKGDRTGRPWVLLWGDWLHRVDVPECTLALLLGDMGGVYHVHRFYLGGGLSVPLCSMVGVPRHRHRFATLSPYFRPLTCRPV